MSSDEVECSPTGNPVSDIMTPAEVAKAYCLERMKRVEMEKALNDAMPFVAIHIDRWARDNGGEMHETHREILDRIGRLIGKPDLSKRLECKGQR